MSHEPDRLALLLDRLRSVEEAPEQRRSGAIGGPQGPSFFTVPLALRDAAVRVRPAAVLAAVILLLVMLAIVGIRVAYAQRAAQPEPIAGPVADEVSASAPAPTPGANKAGPQLWGSTSTDTSVLSATPTTAPAAVYVHVIGAVKEAGVVDVPSGSRVRDVVASAGGLSPNADVSRINLARVVVDAERIWVPVEDEDPPDEVATPTGAADSERAAPGPPGSPAQGDSSAVPVDINSADSSALQTLPGVGPVTAQSIVTWRAENGRFSTVEELLEVSGIGPRTLEKLRPLVALTP